MRRLLTIILLLASLALAVDKAVLSTTMAEGLRDKTNDVVLTSGKVYTYQAGTTTAKATWTDSNKNSAQTNPITLDLNGRNDSTFFDTKGAYKWVIVDSDGVTIDTWDNINFTAVANDITNQTIKINSSMEATNYTVTGDGNSIGLDWKSSTANTIWSVYKEAGSLDFDYEGTRILRLTPNGVEADDAVVAELNSTTINVTNLIMPAGSSISADAITVITINAQAGSVTVDSLEADTFFLQRNQSASDFARIYFYATGATTPGGSFAQNFTLGGTDVKYAVEVAASVSGFNGPATEEILYEKTLFVGQLVSNVLSNNSNSNIVDIDGGGRLSIAQVAVGSGNKITITVTYSGSLFRTAVVRYTFLPFSTVSMDA